MKVGTWSQSSSQSLAHCSWREAHWMPVGSGWVLLGQMKSQVWKTGSGWAKGWNCVHRRYCSSEEPVTTCRPRQKDQAWGSGVEIEMQEKCEWDKQLELG